MRLCLTIEPRGAAFGDTAETASVETARILRRLAAIIEDGRGYPGPIADSRGDLAGEISWRRE